MKRMVDGKKGNRATAPLVNKMLCEEQLNDERHPLSNLAISASSSEYIDANRLGVRGRKSLLLS